MDAPAATPVLTGFAGTDDTATAIRGLLRDWIEVEAGGGWEVHLHRQILRKVCGVRADRGTLAADSVIEESDTRGDRVAGRPGGSQERDVAEVVAASAKDGKGES